MTIPARLDRLGSVPGADPAERRGLDGDPVAFDEHDFPGPDVGRSCWNRDHAVDLLAEASGRGARQGPGRKILRAKAAVAAATVRVRLRLDVTNLIPVPLANTATRHSMPRYPELWTSSGCLTRIPSPERILVTGGTGLIGSTPGNALIDRGDSVVSLSP